MSNLIPEVRVNKNGVPVTKHVLPHSAGSVRQGTIPSPASIAPPEQYNWAETRAVLESHIAPKTNSPKDILWRMEKLESPLRRQVSDALLSDDDYSSFMALTVMEESKDREIPYIIGTLSFHRSIHLAQFKDTMDGEHKGIIRRSAYSSLKSRFSFEHFGLPEGALTEERLAFFKADIVDNTFDFRHAYPVNFEKHAALQELVKNIDLVEAGLPAMVYVQAGLRNWRNENRGSMGEMHLRVPTLLEIAHIVNERPDSVEYFRQYARTRGTFNGEDFLNMIDTESPTLYDGAL